MEPSIRSDRQHGHYGIDRFRPRRKLRGPGVVSRKSQGRRLHLAQAIKLAPKSFEPYISLGLVQMQMGLKSEAKTNFAQALELKPDLPVAHFGLGTILEGENDLAGAKRHFEEAVQQKPDDNRFRQSLERVSKH